MHAKIILFLAVLSIKTTWALDLSKVETYLPKSINSFTFSKNAIANEQEMLSEGVSRYLIDFKNDEISSNTIVLFSVLQQRPIIATRLKKGLYEFTEISKLFDHVYLSTKITASPSKESFLYKIPLKGIYSPNENQSFVLEIKNKTKLSPVKIVKIQDDSAVILSRTKLSDVAVSHLSYLPIEIDENKENSNE